MKILAINSIYHIPISGINQYVRKIGENLSLKNHQYHVLTLKMGTSLKKNNDTKTVFHDNDIKILELPFSKYNTISGHESLNIIPYLLNNLNKYDVVTIHNYYSLWSLLSSLICKLKNKPYVFIPYYHGIRGNIKKGITSYTYDLFSIFGKRIFSGANRVICISQYEKSLVQELVSLPEDRFTIIPPGVDQIHNRKKTKLKNGIIRLLYVGNLFETKGVQYIINAIPIMEGRHKRVDLSIVGDGPFKGDLTELVVDLGLKDSVIFYSNLSDAELKRKYEDVDVFVFLSRSEAYGMVVAEALALGTPCIVANEMALAEFTNEPGCFGVDYPFNPEEIADLIVRVAETDVSVGPFHSKIMTWDQVAGAHERLYRIIES